MESIQMQPVAGRQKSSHKGIKHSVNTAAVGAGTWVVANQTHKALSRIETASAAEFGACNKPYLKNDRVYKFATKIASSLFPKGGKIDKIITRYTGKGYLTGGAERMIKQLRAQGAVAAIASAAILLLAGTGLYTAGKINGNKN